MRHFIVTYVERHYRTMEIEANSSLEAIESARDEGLEYKNHPDIESEFIVEEVK